MIAIDDINDRDSLQQWLTEWPRENGLDEDAARALAITIAHRAAMRVLPLWWEWTLSDEARKRDLTALPILRCSLITGVAALTPTPVIKRAADAYAYAYADADADAADASASAYAAADAAAAAASASAYSYADAAAYAAAYAAAADAADADADAAAAAAAADAAAAAAAADAAAAASASAAARTALWNEIRTDCTILTHKADIFSTPFWSNQKNPFADNWATVKTNATDPQWSFWIKWYDDALAGNPPNWPMLEQIALIKPKVWDAGAEVANAEIKRICDRFHTTENIELFKATLYDFKFDALRHVMLAVPMPQDWETLTDPKQLANFLKDALDLREDMAILSQGFAAEGTAMQGAGATCIYMGQVLDELQNAETVGALRVGKLVEWGRILESVALREDTMREFGAMAEPFQMAVDKLKDLIRNHFAHTLARFSVLRDIHMEDDARPWDVLKELRGIVNDLRSGSDGKLPPLDKKDVVVLDDILDSIDRMIRQLDQTESEESRSSLRRDIDFQMAKVGATAGVYGERARNVLDTGRKAVDESLKWQKRGQGLWTMLRAIREWLESSGGG